MLTSALAAALLCTAVLLTVHAVRFFVRLSGGEAPAPDRETVIDPEGLTPARLQDRVAAALQADREAAVVIETAGLDPLCRRCGEILARREPRVILRDKGAPAVANGEKLWYGKGTTRAKGAIPMNLKNRSFLTLRDFTPEEILYLLDLAAELKDKKKRGIPVDNWRGKNIALIFEKTSTRTRCAFEVAAHDMGMGVTYLDPSGSQIGKKESIKDTARVLGRMFDGIEYRGFGQQIVQTLAEYAGVPVWNGLTDEYHPTQMLADMLTVREHLGRLAGVKFVYVGDARFNTGNSLMIVCAKLGLDFVACAPKKYWPDAGLVETCRTWCAASGGSITLTESVAEAAAGADVISTDVWVSMGEPDAVWEERIRDLRPYQVNGAMMALAKPTAIFMHCLPAFHDLDTTIGRTISEKFGIDEMEVTDAVFESEQSVVFDEAENRMHTIKAVMAATLEETVR